jgi:hypothetical protein
MFNDLVKITARLKNIAIVEDVSAELGYAAMRISLPNGTQKVDVAKSPTEWKEWQQNVKDNHERGYCVYVDYDKLL